MKKIKGFTLIELLVVIGILTIIAGIAVPNYLNAQVRAKVARAHSDMRSLVTALEAYRVDRNSYPVACRNGISHDIELGEENTRLGVPDKDGHRLPPQRDSNDKFLTCYLNCNDAVIMATWPQRETPASWRSSFSVDPGFKSLTTPTAYISNYPKDPFADTLGLVYGYVNIENQGWILWSFGPDCDESDGGEVGEATSKTRFGNNLLRPGVAMNWPTKPIILDQEGWMRHGSWMSAALHDEMTTETQWVTYHPELRPQATSLLVCGYTYDPTNGISSGGDVWRIKQ